MATKVSDAAIRMRVRGGSSDELAVIAQRAQAFTNAAGTAIALSEGNAAEIICRARAGSSAPEVGTALRVDGTFTGLCIQSGKELRCDDAETDARVDKAAIRALGIRSMVAIPIKGEGRVVGVLAAFAPTAHAFRVTHVVVLKTMADQIAAYLQRMQRDEAYSPEPLPAPPGKAIAASAAASRVPPAAAVVKPAEPALTQRQLPVARRVKPGRARPLPEDIDPSSQKKETEIHDEPKELKTGLRLSANVLMIGAAAVMVIAIAIGVSLKLRRSGATPEPALAASSSPGTPAVPAPAPADVQPPAKDTPLGPPAKYDEAQPEREEVQPKRAKTVVLPAAPSRIPASRDNSTPTFDVPAISLGNVPTSGFLPNLVSPGSQPSHPRFVTESELEPVTVIKKVPPVYPLVAKQSRLTGVVVVTGTVNKNGRIGNLQQVSGSPIFREAAFAALKQWVFKPARLNGQAIEQSTTIRLHFGVP